MPRKQNKGFTLLEILLVIATIGILAAIVLVAINPNRQLAQARNLVRQSDINTIQKALEQYLIENRSYPLGITNTYKEICNTGSNNTTQGTVSSECIDLRELVPTYIASIPVNPSTSTHSGYYVWINDVNKKIAVLAGKGENGKIIGVNNLKENIVTDGLVLYLDAGNTTSYPGTGNTWFDLSGSGNNGELMPSVGGPTYSSSNGGSLVFDGVNDYVARNSTTINLSSGVTMEMIFKSTDMNSRAQGFMQYNIHPYYINFYTLGDGKLRWETWVPAWSAGGSFFTPTVLSNNTWYHAAGTFFNGSSILYINGVNVASASQTSGNYGSSYTANLVIGDYYGYTSGNIAVAKLYNRALTAAEVQQNFNATRVRFGL